MSLSESSNLAALTKESQAKLPFILEEARAKTLVFSNYLMPVDWTVSLINRIQAKSIRNNWQAQQIARTGNPRSASRFIC
jgi:hypothetical protein